MCVLWHILSIKGKINFLQFGRFSQLAEQTYRDQFEKEFDFLAFNKQLINHVASVERVVAWIQVTFPRQARSENKLDFHFNAALTAINLAKQDWISNKNDTHKRFSMANYKTLYNNTLMLERFMCRFAINPNTTKNQKIVKELLDYGKIAA